MNIHFIWIGGQQVPLKYINNFNTCQKLNPEFSCILWNNDQCLELLKENNLLEYWSTLSFICKCNLLKYLILDKFGGIYSDLDIIWKIPFVKILNNLGFNYFNAIFTVLNNNPINIRGTFFNLIDDPFIMCQKGILGKYIDYCKVRTNLKYDGDLYNTSGQLKIHKLEPVGPFSLTEWLYTESNIKFNLMDQSDLLNGRCLYGYHEQNTKWNTYLEL